MAQQLEIEFKNVLTKQQYEQLLEDFQIKKMLFIVKQIIISTHHLMLFENCKVGFVFE